MKILITAVSLLFLQTINAQNIIEVPANQSFEIAFPDTPDQFYSLKNDSYSELTISVVNKVSGEQISGFGLAKNGEASVYVPQLGALRVFNSSENPATLKFQVKSSAPQPVAATDVYIDFTLRNETMQSIPLIIPGVMNPNLSPKSNSGVSLLIGQEVKFKNRGKVYTLFIVDDSISNGEVLKVGELLAARMVELGLK